MSEVPQNLQIKWLNDIVSLRYLEIITYVHVCFKMCVCVKHLPNNRLNINDAHNDGQKTATPIGIRSLVPPLIGPPSHWSPSHWFPNSLVPQYIIGAHRSPISLVPHLIGPPFH